MRLWGMTEVTDKWSLVNRYIAIANYMQLSSLYVCMLLQYAIVSYRSNYFCVNDVAM